MGSKHLSRKRILETLHSRDEILDPLWEPHRIPLLWSNTGRCESSIWPLRSSAVHSRMWPTSPYHDHRTYPRWPWALFNIFKLGQITKGQLECGQVVKFKRHILKGWWPKRLTGHCKVIFFSAPTFLDTWPLGMWESAEEGYVQV